MFTLPLFFFFCRCVTSSSSFFFSVFFFPPSFALAAEAKPRHFTVPRQKRKKKEHELQRSHKIEVLFVSFFRIVIYTMLMLLQTSGVQLLKGRRSEKRGKKSIFFFVWALPT